MKKFTVLFAAIASFLAGGCLNNGSPAEPPPGFTATAGDGRVTLTWNAAPGVDYWLFTATDSALTAFNWTGLTNAHVYPSAASPFYICGLLDGTQYWYAANGRVDGGPGGASSPTISATPYKSGSAWSANAPLTQNLSSPNLFGVGYAGLKTCSNNTSSAAGNFAAVGAGASIFTSTDGATWVSQPAPSGFSSDLYAVAGYAANQNNPGNPALRWVAVGAGGASVYSTDGAVWAVGNPANSNSTANPNNHALRSLTQVAGAFFAVGDGGTILSGTDGITWTARTSGTTSNLNGITHGVMYVAVGDNGTILTSPDGATWTTRTSGTSNILRQVSSIFNTYVAVGNGGTIVTSTDGGATWTVQSALPGTPDLVSIAANSQQATFDINSLTFAGTAIAANSQFVAIDSSGKAYTSTDSGVTWSPAIDTGAASLNALVSSGFGYVAAGNAGATVTSF